MAYIVHSANCFRMRYHIEDSRLLGLKNKTNYVVSLLSVVICSLIQKQLAYMLGRQQIFLELDEDMDDYDELVEIICNVQLNNHFLALGREVKHILHFTGLLSN